MKRAEMMTVSEVAEVMGISPATVYHWVKTYRLPKPKRIGGRYYWEREEIYRRWKISE